MGEGGRGFTMQVEWQEIRGGKVQAKMTKTLMPLERDWILLSRLRGIFKGF